MLPDLASAEKLQWQTAPTGLTGNFGREPAIHCRWRAYTGSGDHVLLPLGS